MTTVTHVLAGSTAAYDDYERKQVEYEIKPALRTDKAQVVMIAMLRMIAMMLMKIEVVTVKAMSLRYMA